MHQDSNQENPLIAKIIMVTGGQRSGKSVFAENLALNLAERPTYIATAKVMDPDMRRRVEKHKERRHSHWNNIESPLDIAGFKFCSNEVVLIDCLTLWATNWFFEKEESAESALAEIKQQLDQLSRKPCTFIIVTNEIGLGGISSSALQRQFTDLQGAANQYLASLSKEVYMIVSGIPVKLRG